MSIINPKTILKPSPENSQTVEKSSIDESVAVCPDDENKHSPEEPSPPIKAEHGQGEQEVPTGTKNSSSDSSSSEAGTVVPGFSGVMGSALKGAFASVISAQPKSNMFKRNPPRSIGSRPTPTLNRTVGRKGGEPTRRSNGQRYHSFGARVCRCGRPKGEQHQLCRSCYDSQREDSAFNPLARHVPSRPKETSNYMYVEAEMEVPPLSDLPDQIRQRTKEEYKQPALERLRNSAKHAKDVAREKVAELFSGVKDLAQLKEGSAVYANIKKHMKALWDNIYFKVAFVSALSGFLVRKVLQFFRKADLGLITRLKGFVLGLSGLFSGLTDSMTGAFSGLVERFQEFFTPTQAINIKSEVENVGIFVEEKEISDQESLEEEAISGTKDGFIVRGVTFAIAMVTGFFTKIFDPSQWTLPNFAQLVKVATMGGVAIKTLQGGTNFVLGLLPGIVQKAIYRVSGLGKVNPKLKGIYEQLRYLTYVQQTESHFKTNPARREQVRMYAEAALDVAEVGVPLPGSLGHKMQSEILTMLKALGAATIDPGGKQTPHTAAAIIMYGPPGLGKTYGAQSFVANFSGDTASLLYESNATKHEDGWVGQPFVLYDEVFSNPNDPEEAKTLQEILKMTSYGVNISIQAFDKGRTKKIDVVFMTSNTHPSTFLSQMSNPDAFKRRFYGKTGCCFEYIPRPEVMTRGSLDASKLSALSGAAKANWEHMYVKYTYHHGNKLVAKTITSPTELNLIIAKTILNCRSMDAMITRDFQDQNRTLCKYAGFTPREVDLLDSATRTGYLEKVVLTGLSRLIDNEEPKVTETSGDGLLDRLEKKIAGSAETSLNFFEKGLVQMKRPVSWLDEFCQTNFDGSYFSLVACAGLGSLVFAAIAGEEIVLSFKETVKSAPGESMDLTEEGDDDVMALIVPKDFVSRRVFGEVESMGPPSKGSHQLKEKTTFKIKNRSKPRKTRSDKSTSRGVNGVVEAKLSKENPSHVGIVRKIQRWVLPVQTVLGRATCFMYGGNMMLLNSHLLSRIQGSVQNLSLADGYLSYREEHEIYFGAQTIYIQRNDGTKLAVELADNNIHIVDYDGKREAFSDVAFVSTPPGIGLPPAACMEKFFCSRDVWPLVDGQIGYLIKGDSVLNVGVLTTSRNTHWPAPSMDSNGTRVQRAYPVGANYRFLYEAETWEGNGLCGCPLVVVLNGMPCIVAIHCGKYSDTIPARYKNGVRVPAYVSHRGAAVGVCREMLALEFDSRYVGISVDDPISVECEVGSNSSSVLGPSFNNHYSVKSNIYVGPFKEFFPNCPGTSGYEPTNMLYPMRERLAKAVPVHPNIHVDDVLLQECALDALECFNGQTKSSYVCPLEASISGYNHPLCTGPMVGPMDLTTSLGLRMKKPGKTTKKWGVVDCGDHCEPNQELMGNMQRILDVISQGYIPLDPVACFYKDEATKESKRDRPRVIRNYTLAMNALVRSYFAEDLYQFFARGPRSESFIGSNPESSDWDRFVNRINRNSRRWCSTDCAGMDDSHKWAVLKNLIKAINRRHTDKANNHIREKLFLAIFMRLDVFLNNMELVWGALGSGSVLTTFINTLVVLVFLRYSFIKSSRLRNEPATLEAFHRAVGCGAGGDDGVFSVDDNISRFNPADVARWMGYDDEGNELYKVTPASKNGSALGWSQMLGEVTFFSRAITTRNLGVPWTYKPVFSPKRFGKSLTWFRAGVLSERGLAVEKANGLLLLMLGHGRPMFDKIRDVFMTAMASLGVSTRLRTFEDCLEIWTKPGVHSTFVHGSVVEMSTLSNVVCEMDVVSKALGKASNIVGVVARSVDEISAEIGRDKPNTGLVPTRFTPTSPFFSNVINNVTNCQVMGADSAPTWSLSPSNFGVISDETTFEHLCRPTYSHTFPLSVNDPPGKLLTQGVLSMTPGLGAVGLGDTFQPLACEYIAAKFFTWHADITITLEVIAPKTMVTKIAFVALPMVTSMPDTIDEIQSTYVQYRDVRDGANTFAFEIPYQADTPRKYVASGSTTLENSFGIWGVFLFTGVSAPASTASSFPVNVYQGAKSISLDGYGLHNGTLSAVLAADAPPPTKRRGRRGVSEHKHYRRGFSSYVNVEVEMDTKGAVPLGRGVGLDTPGLVPSDGKDPGVPSSTNSALRDEAWTMSQMAERAQLLASFTYGLQPEGSVLATIEVPHQAIVGTHVTPFVRFKQFRGDLVLTFSTPGQLNIAGALVVCVVPAMAANAAVQATDSKVSQTFVSHTMLKPQDANTATVRVPFCFWKSSHELTSEPWATVVVRVFNTLVVGPASTPSVSFSVLSHWENVSFSFINPVPSQTSSHIRSIRRKFIAQMSGRTKLIRGVLPVQESRAVNGVVEMMENLAEPDPSLIETKPDVTVAEPSVPQPIERKVRSVNELLKRFVPVSYSTVNSNVVRVPILDLFSLSPRESTSMVTAFGWFGAIFNGFAGQIRMYVYSGFQKATHVYFLPSSSMIDDDVQSLVDGSTSSSGFGPSAFMGRQIPGAPVMSTWISTQNYARLPKYSTSSVGENILGTMYVDGKQNSPSQSPLYIRASFSDNSRLGLPMGIPRIKVRSTNVGGDTYPPSGDSIIIGEYIDFTHVVGAPSTTYSQESLALVADSAVAPEVTIPLTGKAQCQSMRMPTNLLSRNQLLQLGFIFTETQNVVLDPELQTRINSDLTNLFCVPVSTRVMFDSQASGTLSSFIGQPLFLENQTTSLEDGGTQYQVGEAALVTPPWTQSYLETMWIAPTEFAVPHPSQSTRSFQPNDTVVIDTVTYGQITTNPRSLLVIA